MFTAADIDKFVEVQRSEQAYRHQVDELFSSPHANKDFSLRDLCVIARQLLSGSAFGSRLETVLKQRFSLTDAPDEISGDAKSHKLGNIEIKVSLGDKDDAYCLAQQVRPFHSVDYYLCMYYNIRDDEVSLHLVPAVDMIKICLEYGGKSHGTKSRHDHTTDHELGVFGSKFAATTSKKWKAWNAIHQYHRTEQELLTLL